MKRVLIVAAHPDDEVLGCFATAARLAREGVRVYTLILGEGKNSRYSESAYSAEEEIDILREEMLEANRLIGVEELFTHDFPDNRFDSVDLLDIVKEIERVKNMVKPDTIFTHFEDDLNIDHRITYEAVLTACRPMPGECVAEIYSFEVLSSTEWRYPNSFSPDIFFDVKDSIALKVEAMSKYRSELRDYPHPRSLEAIELSARYWGMRVGLEYAEAFKCIRKIY
jgi:LmbE family N-acetylglucosaminyl deacetylase